MSEISPDEPTRPSVVVLVPTLNNAADLARSLTALDAQTYRPFRVAVVDSHSNDETPALAAKHGALYLNTDTSNRADACNEALRRLDCDIVVFTDDDCFPPTRWLENLVRHFSRPEVAGVGGPNVAPPDQGVWGKAADVAFGAWGFSFGTRYGKSGGELAPIAHNSGCNAAYRKRVVDEAGGFPAGSIGGEDVVLDQRITSNGHRLWYDPEAVTFHRRRESLKSFARMGRSYGRGRLHVSAARPEPAQWVFALPLLALAAFASVGLVSAGVTLASVAGGRSWDEMTLLALVAPLGAVVLFFLASLACSALSRSPYRSLGTVARAPLILGTLLAYYALGYLQGLREVLRGRLEADRDVGVGKNVRGR